MALLRTHAQDEPPKDLGPPAPGKRWFKTRRVENGFEVDAWVQIDDIEGLAWPARSELRVLNRDHARLDGPDKVSGKARYAADVRLEGMLFGRILTSPHGSALVTLDLAPALAIDGVEAAISLLARDVFEGSVRFLGQPVAAVAARTPELADDALRAIVATYRVQPSALSYDAAVRPDAPKVRERGNVSEDRQDGDREKAEAALGRCDFVAEGRFDLPVQHHVCLETHGVTVDYRGGDEATVWASTQGTFTLGEDAARALGLPANAVRVRVENMGGGFGSKFGLGSEGLAACRLAKQAGRPVHLLLARGDEFVMGGNRSGARQTLRGGATSDGRFKALVADVAKLGGTGSGSNAGQPYIYDVEERYLGMVSVRTNTDSSRAMRAPGHPQASFAIESIVDDLAYGIGMDPVEFRKKNLRDEAFHRQLDRAAAEIGWNEHPHRTVPGDARRALAATDEADEKLVGIGFAVARWWGGGGLGCETEVRIERDGSVQVALGTQDLGTGTRTYMAGIVAEVLGLELAGVDVRIGDSRLGKATASGGSTTTGSVSPSVLIAARKAADELAGAVARASGAAPSAVSFSRGEVRVEGGESLSWKRACGLLPSAGLAVTGTWHPDLQGGGVHGANAAKVEVDVATGRVRVLDFVAVHDCGLPLNRLALRSQINGGIIQALSYGLLEERVIDDVLGVALTSNLIDYKIAAAAEIPPMQAIIDDGDERTVPIGMSEAAVIPGHAAIANAIRNACGVRLSSTPFTPDKILDALHGRS
mgnify:CR=1 FL=1